MQNIAATTARGGWEVDFPGINAPLKLGTSTSLGLLFGALELRSAAGGGDKVAAGPHYGAGAGIFLDRVTGAQRFMRTHQATNG